VRPWALWEQAAERDPLTAALQQLSVASSPAREG